MDIVSKPIETKELAPFLASVASGSAVSGTARGTNLEEQDAGPSNALAWDITKALEALGGDEQLLHEVMEIFLVDLPKNMSMLRQAVAEGNADALAKTAHSLKGELGYLGISELSQKAGELEEMGWKQDLEHACKTFAGFEVKMSAIVASIQTTNRVRREIALSAKAPGSQEVSTKRRKSPPLW